jgi:hypothetical protein
MNHNNTFQRKDAKQMLLAVMDTKIKAAAALASGLADLKERLRSALPDDIAQTHSRLFLPSIDECALAEAFRSVYDAFFGAVPKERLSGAFQKPVDLAAYFFIIAEWHGWGNATFSEKGKKPFFRFLKASLGDDNFHPTLRTLHNRLTLTMGDFRRRLMEEPLTSTFKSDSWKRDFFIKDFLKVVEIFHTTPFFRHLPKA